MNQLAFRGPQGQEMHFSLNCQFCYRLPKSSYKSKNFPFKSGFYPSYCYYDYYYCELLIELIWITIKLILLKFVRNFAYILFQLKVIEKWPESFHISSFQKRQNVWKLERAQDLLKEQVFRLYITGKKSVETLAPPQFCCHWFLCF